jgi:adenylate cyclase
MRFWAAALWRKSLELFSCFPIRYKLTVIIGAIVLLVMSVFSVIVLLNQQYAIKKRTTQMCQVLVQNLAVSLEDHMLFKRYDKVREVALRLLQKSSIDGFRQFAIWNRDDDLIVKHPENEVVPNIKKTTVSLNELKENARGDYYYASKIVTRQVYGQTVRTDTLGTMYFLFSKDEIFAPMKDASKVAIGAAMFIILFSSIGIYLIARKMARQIQLLSNGARAVGSGNLNVQISVNTKDELGSLANEFNSMIQQLREKWHMQKFMSKLTVDMIKDTVRTRGKDVKASRRNVAVLFCDVRNFSSIAEMLEPEDIVKLINIYFDLQTRIIERHHGIVDKFMGDQIMAIFQGRGMADNVLRAAVEIQRQIRTLNQERAAAGLATLEIGIGINNGMAVMGHMGSANRMDYTVIGDVVNVAARLCAAAKAGQIITSLELAHKVNGSYPTSRLKSVSVKGRSQAIEVCEVDYDRDILL